MKQNTRLWRFSGPRGDPPPHTPHLHCTNLLKKSIGVFLCSTNPTISKPPYAMRAGSALPEVVVR